MTTHNKVYIEYCCYFLLVEVSYQMAAVELVGMKIWLAHLKALEIVIGLPTKINKMAFQNSLDS